MLDELEEDVEQKLSYVSTLSVVFQPILREPIR